MKIREPPQVAPKMAAHTPVPRVVPAVLRDPTVRSTPDPTPTAIVGPVGRVDFGDKPRLPRRKSLFLGPTARFITKADPTYERHSTSLTDPDPSSASAAPPEAGSRTATAPFHSLHDRLPPPS